MGPFYWLVLEFFPLSFAKLMKNDTNHKYKLIKQPGTFPFISVFEEKKNFK